jgi:AraC-like DNA-binding protein
MRIAMTRVEVSYRIQQEDWIARYTAMIIMEVSYRTIGEDWVPM